MHLAAIPFGTYTVSEEAGAGTTLDHYDISIICINEETGHAIVDDPPDQVPFRWI